MVSPTELNAAVSAGAGATLAHPPPSTESSAHTTTPPTRTTPPTPPSTGGMVPVASATSSGMGCGQRNRIEDGGARVDAFRFTYATGGTPEGMNVAWSCVVAMRDPKRCEMIQSATSVLSLK